MIIQCKGAKTQRRKDRYKERNKYERSEGAGRYA